MKRLPGDKMKNILIGLGAIIGVVLTIVIIRTMMLPPPPAGEPKAPPIAVDANAAAQHLAEAIRFKTVSYGEGKHEAEKIAALQAMRTWLEQTYPNFHRVASREIINDSLLFTWKGTDTSKQPILLMAHMDVVPVVPGTENDWKHAPFSGDIAGGYVWGRGAIDDKGCLIMLLEAAEKLAATGFTPARTIMFAFGQDEEVGGDMGNAVIAKTLAARGVHFAWVLDEGGALVDEPLPGVKRPIADMAVSEKGYLSLRLTAHGEGGHSSMPTHDMAILRIADAVRAVVDHPFVSGLDDVQRAKLRAIAPLLPFVQRAMIANLWLTEPLVVRNLERSPQSAALLHTTIAPTMISAGVKDNVIPPTATATINFRLHPRDTVQSVIAHVKDAINDPKVDVTALTETQSEASKVADLHGANYAFVAGQISQSFGVPVAPDMLGAATDSRHYQPLADDVFRLDPFHFGPDDFHRIHGTNERLAIVDMAPAIGFYMRLMQGTK